MLMLDLWKSKLGSCFLKRESGTLFESFRSLHKQARTPLFRTWRWAPVSIILLVMTVRIFITWNETLRKMWIYIYCNKFVLVQVPFSVWHFYSIGLKFILILGTETKLVCDFHLYQCFSKRFILGAFLICS